MERDILKKAAAYFAKESLQWSELGLSMPWVLQSIPG
jgi:hypothetical protein